VIPEAAYEAAYEVSGRLDISASDIERILEAAAPYLWEAAYRAGHLDAATGVFRPWHHYRTAK